MIPFKILSIEEIEAEVLKEKGDIQNFPKTVDFPLPEHYKSLVIQIKTIEIASEAILYNAVEAVNENKEFVLPDYWCFAGNGQGDRWFFDRKGVVFFYDHDYDERLKSMNISFEQWMQMAFVIRKLDLCFDEYDDILGSARQSFYEVLNIIHPKLGENYPFTV